MPTITVWIETEEEEKEFTVDFAMEGSYEPTKWGGTPETSYEGHDDREFSRLEYEPKPTPEEEKLIYAALEEKWSDCAELWEDHCRDLAEEAKYGL